MSTFADIIASSSRKSVLITGCDMYPGYAIVCEFLKHKGKYFKKVCAGYYHENHMVHLLKQRGVETVQMSISHQDKIHEAYQQADVVVVVPPINDEKWGKGHSSIYVKAAEKAKVRGLVLCSKINPKELKGFEMLEPLCEMEQALEELKGKIECVSLIRCSVHIDLLWLFRHQIAKKHELCLPVTKNARFAPLTECDSAEALYRMLVESKFPTGIYELTGPEEVNFDYIAQYMSKAVGKSIKYEHVKGQEMEHYLKQRKELSEHEIRFICEMLEAVSKEMFSKKTDDLKKLLEREPMSVEHYLKKNSNEFKPEGN